MIDGAPLFRISAEVGEVRSLGAAPAGERRVELDVYRLL